MSLLRLKDRRKCDGEESSETGDKKDKARMINKEKKRLTATIVILPRRQKTHLSDANWIKASAFPILWMTEYYKVISSRLH